MNKKTINILLVGGLVIVGVLLCVRYCSSPNEGESSKIQMVNPDQLQPGLIRTESLNDDQIQRIKCVRQVFLEVDPSSLEEWIDNFRRDLHPDREIQIWEAMADAYEGFCQSRELTIEAKKEVFGLVLIRSTASEAFVLETVELNTLTEAESREVLSGYTNKPDPIKIIKH